MADNLFVHVVERVAFVTDFDAGVTLIVKFKMRYLTPVAGGHPLLAKCAYSVMRCLVFFHIPKSPG
jgi:hypothetical protein